MLEKDTGLKESAKQAETEDPKPLSGEKSETLPTGVMPDASGDELRKEIRSLRDENKSRRLTQSELEDRFKDLDGRFAQLDDDNKKIQDKLKDAKFRSLALEAGVDIGLIPFLDITNFDLEDNEKVLELLRKLPTTGNLPSAGKTVSPKKGKKLTVADIEGMSDAEFEERKEEIVALQRDQSYR